MFAISVSYKILFIFKIILFSISVKIRLKLQYYLLHLSFYILWLLGPDIWIFQKHLRLSFYILFYVFTKFVWSKNDNFLDKKPNINFLFKKFLKSKSADYTQ